MEHPLAGRPPLLSILPQPDDITCGPTCLHAVYRYHGDHISLDQIIEEVPMLPAGGTLAVVLAAHALRRGYRAVLYTYNFLLFDPTWFDEPDRIADRLRAQLAYKKKDAKLQLATMHYLEFLELGGEIRFEDMNEALLLRYLRRGKPILTGLSATYLYRCAREFNDDYDDIRGEPTGHFVVLADYDEKDQIVWVADPLADNPGFQEQRYPVRTDRLISAILLGIVTWDANVLLLEPRTPG